MALCIHLNIGELLAFSGEISISEGFFYSLVGYISPGPGNRQLTGMGIGKLWLWVSLCDL